MKTGYLIAAIGGALLIILGLQYFLFAPEDVAQQTAVVEPAADVPVETPAVAEPEPIAVAPVAETQPQPAVEPLPNLADSDDWLRARLEGLPFPASWLQIDQLLRRGAAVLDNLAQGTYPRSQLGFLVPQEKFPVVRQGERYFIDPAGYARFDYLPDLLEGVPLEDLVALWRHSRPMLVEALAELGQSEPPETLLRKTLAHMQEVPLLRPQELELVRPGVQFAFRADELEQRNDLQKQLLRMGPDNIRRLRERLGQLLATLSPA